MGNSPPKVPPPPAGARTVPVYLNVYNLQDSNKRSVMSSLGFGLYHSGVEVHGAEWAFGGSTEAVKGLCGIFCVTPRTALPASQFHRQVRLGETALPVIEVQRILIEMAPEWTADTYHLLSRNCNHFSEAFVARLRNDAFAPFPPWVNRAARMADVFVPERVYQAMMRRVPQPPSGAGGGGPSFTPTDRQGGQQGGGRRPSAPAEPAEPLPPVAALRGMSVRELKTAMFVHGVSWEGCLEKEELVAACERFRAETAGR